MSWPKGKSRSASLRERKPLTLPVWWPYKVTCEECGANALFNDLAAHRDDCTIMHAIRAEIHPLYRGLSHA